jgi:hypothetical protein
MDMAWNTARTNEPSGGDHARAVEILRDAELPETLNIEIRKLPPGVDGTYDPEADTLVLPSAAPAMTILREGARAEYHRRAMSGKPFPADSNARIGLLLASHAYVGIRLAGFAGFSESENGALSALGASTVGEWAAKYESAADVRGTRYEGTLASMSGFRGLLRMLAVVVAERQNGEVVLGADLERAVPAAGDVLRSIIAATLQLVRKDERLFELDRLRALGKNTSDKLAAMK